MDLYFQRHDGQAVTTDDFVQAMQDASGVDLTQFRRWYDQAGTPVLQVAERYDAAARTYTLTLEQSCPPTPASPRSCRCTFRLPSAWSDAQGADMPLRLEGEAAPGGTSRVLSFTQPQQRFTFVDVPSAPVPFAAARLLRAGDRRATTTTTTTLAHLLAHDSDPFNRWEAGQRLALNLLLRAVEAQRAGRQPAFPDTFASAFAQVLDDGARDPAFAAEALALPSESYIAEQMDVVDPDAIHAVRVALRQYLARTLKRRAAGRLSGVRSAWPLQSGCAPGRPARAEEPVPLVPDGAATSRRRSSCACISSTPPTT